MFWMQQISSAVVAFVAVLVSSIFISSLAAQTVEPPAVEWERTFGGAGRDRAYSVQQTTDGGYIVAGFTGAFFADNADVYLIKTDAQGNAAPGWPKTFGGAGDDRAYSVQQTDDGGYIVAGSTESFGAGSVDVYLIKTDANGNVFAGWPKTFGGFFTDWAYSVQQTTDGGYIMAGATNSFRTSNMDVYLIKTDVQGNISPGWPTIFSFQYSDGDIAYSVQQTIDGGYIVAGQISSFITGNMDVNLIKTDANGNAEPGWPKTYGGAGTDWAYSIQQTTDGGYVVTGVTASFSVGAYDAYLIKTDSTGNLLWQKTFGDQGDNQARSIQQTTDGGYITAGLTNSFGGYDVYLIKTDANGNLNWSRTVGGSHDDEAYSVQQTDDGGYIVAGWTESFGAGFADVYLIKLSTDSLQPPTNLIANYSISSSLVTLTWESSPSATVDRYIVERKLGCEAWQVYDDNFSANGPTVYHDGVPYGTSVCYRVSAANALGVSKPTAPACLAVPIGSRYQLKLYDPDTPNPFNPDAGAWVDFYPCDWRFKPDRGTAVIVHGWNPPAIGGGQLEGWMLETAKLISERFNGLVNILAWDWEDEATGTGADGPVPEQVVALSNTLKSSVPVAYDRPLHLMGHSNGALIASATALELLEPRQSTPGILHPHQLTLWDPPDLGVVSNLTDQVSNLRNRDVYVELYYGVSAIGTHGANLWVNVPGGPLWPWPFQCAAGIEGHRVHQWYRCTIPTDSQEADPVLFRYQPGSVCEIEPLPVGTIGFGTSVLLFGLANRPDSRDCPKGTLSFGLRRSCPTDFENRGEHFVLLGTENCESAPPTTLVIVSDLNTGDYWLREDWQPNFSFVNSTEMFFGAQAGGEGGGAGGGDLGEPDVRYTLNLVIEPEWDYFSFDYDFTEAAASTTLSVTIAVGEEIYPVFQMSSDLVLAEGYLNTGLRDIRQLHGQTVSIAFELRSEQPGMLVYLRNLTFWRDPWHDNRAPLANAGPDQVIDPDINGLATVILDASATVDPDGDTLDFWWMLENGVLAVGIQPAAQLFSGNHRIQLVVRDLAGQVSTDEVLVVVTGEILFRRCDSNNDGTVDISDAVNTLGYLFSGTGNTTCPDAADANDSGTLDISDAIFTLGFLFLGTPTTIPAPYPDRGPDPSPDQIGCDFYPL